MTFFDWLATPDGRNVVDAVVVLLSALAAYFSYQAHEQAAQNKEMLNGHMQTHIDQISDTPKKQNVTES